MAKKLKYPIGSIVELKGKIEIYRVPIGSVGTVTGCNYDYQVLWDHKDPTTGSELRSWVHANSLKDHEVFIEGDDDDDCI